MKIQGTILNPGEAEGPTLILTEPLSFWGAFDPRTGAIVDTHHAQCGTRLGGHILLLPETRGSGGTPGGIAEAVRRGTGPLGIILITPRHQSRGWCRRRHPALWPRLPGHRRCGR
jgi:predicted aconitase with swiveling domain